jgi:hypothetical protein
MTISAVNGIRQDAIDQSFDIYDKNVRGIETKKTDESVPNPVDKSL